MAQLYQAVTFQKFDYGYFVNYEKYNQSTPQTIDLSKITTPVALFLGEDDQIADRLDNELLRDQLPNVVEFKVLENHDHLSVSFSKDMSYFEEVIQLMN